MAFNIPSDIDPYFPLRAAEVPAGKFANDAFSPLNAVQPFSYAQMAPAKVTPGDRFSKKTPELSERAKKAAMAGGLLAAALLIRRLPQTAIGHHPLLPADWKVWARAGLGAAAIGQANQAVGWKPPVWVNALAAVSLIHPLLAGFSQKTARKLVVLAPLVAGVVQGTSFVSKYTEKFLDEKAKIPPLATQLAFSAGMIGAGLFAFPPALKRMTQAGWMGKVAKEELDAAAKKAGSSAHAAAEKVAVAICPAGCCGSAICVSEVGGLASAFWGWLTNPLKSNNQPKAYQS